jgi:hypothetical protein
VLLNLEPPAVGSAYYRLQVISPTAYPIGLELRYTTGENAGKTAAAGILASSADFLVVHVSRRVSTFEEGVGELVATGHDFQEYVTSDLAEAKQAWSYRTISLGTYVIRQPRRITYAPASSVTRNADSSDRVFDVVSGSLGGGIVAPSGPFAA